MGLSAMFLPFVVDLWMAEVQNHVSPFATLQNPRHTSFFPWETSEHNPLKTLSIFPPCWQNILYRFQATKLAHVSSKCITATKTWTYRYEDSSFSTLAINMVSLG